MLDNRGDRSSGWGVNELRGGKPYNPPIGWIGFGLRVLDRYDNGDNTWLDYLNKPGEWSVAYHGIGASLSGQVNLNNVNNLLGNINMMNTVIRQQFKEEMDKLKADEKAQIAEEKARLKEEKLAQKQAEKAREIEIKAQKALEKEKLKEQIIDILEEISQKKEKSIY